MHCRFCCNVGFIQDICPPLVVNVGGHVGLFELHLAEKWGQAAADVYTFEPAGPTFECLVSNLAQAGLLGDSSTSIRVHPIRAAIGATSSPSAPLTYFPNMPGNSTFHPQSKDAMRALMSDATAAECLVSETVDARVMSFQEALRKFRWSVVGLLKVRTPTTGAWVPWGS